MGIRAALRGKVMRAVDEVVARYHVEHLAELREELAQVRSGIDDRVRREVDRAVAEAREIEVRARRDLFAAAEREAVASSARFVQREMADAASRPDPHATLDYALSLAPTGGMALEFGVYTGSTLKLIAAARDGGGVYGFDSFDGLPETWRAGFRAGAFGVEGQPPEVPGAELVVGLFDETLPGFLAEHPGPVDLLHIDADLYSSAATVLELVGPRLRRGSVIVFDEFFNYPGWEDHEARAWWEYVAAHPGLGFRYAAYTHDNEQVVVRLG
ncbi:class I SAM-dependent methyltransferase [Pseudonocardia acidicola]|uniref:Class I SAM-dependent methyltransferase n=1 Tax=Pseudonocardia acidicola TaxID=2724939 RepID=A0ABX1SGK4_9PSEU|nr:class I SAM-dependent methyltransferase [Pseudonocardia acidicola]NMI00065.1 class I SAM-dependent methyltransferase [Pseudonocardia acidicola]